MLRVPLRLSASWISMSGFTPGVIRRKTFISASSPKASEELLCSPLNSVEWVERSRWCSPVRWKVSPESVTWVPGSPSGETACSNSSSQVWVASRSCRAS